MARPTKYGEPLAKPRSFRLTETDDEAFEQKLVASGLEQSELIRDYILRGTKLVEVVARPSKQERAERRALMAAVNRVGNNINQIAYQANAAAVAGTISAELFERIAYRLEVIDTFLRRGV